MSLKHYSDLESNNEHVSETSTQETQGREQNILAAIESRAFTRRSIVFCTSSKLLERLPFRDSFSCSSSNASITPRVYTELAYDEVDVFRRQCHFTQGSRLNAFSQRLEL